MSDDNPFDEPPQSRLTGAQQDRAAGLLVGMAVGEGLMSPTRNEQDPRRSAGDVTEWAVSRLEKDPFYSYGQLQGDVFALYLSLVLSGTSSWVLGGLREEPKKLFDNVRKSMEFDAENMEIIRHPRSLGIVCGLWASMLQHAVLTGEADLRAGLAFIADDADRTDWSDAVHSIERGTPFEDHDGLFELLSNIWLHVSPPHSARRSHRFACLMGSIQPDGMEPWSEPPLVGAALGAIHGCSAIPWAWRRFLKDARGDSTEHLMRTAISATLELEYLSDRWPDFQRGEPQESAFSTTVAHPSDPGVLLGGLGSLDDTTVDAVVGLCHTGSRQRPLGISQEDHATFWLIDSDDPQDNPNLDFVLEDAARAVLTLRKEGKTVLLHGVAGASRTPTVAAHYGALITGRSVWEEFQGITRALPQTAPNAGFLRHLASADVRPREVTEELVVEQAPFGHLAVDRQLIELLSWTIAAELLKKDHADGWVGPMDGPEDGFVLLLGSDRIEFLRAGAGIALNGEPFMSWEQVITAGGPQVVVARLEAELGLLFKGCVVIGTVVPTWKPEFAAALVRGGFGQAASVRVQPLPRGSERRGLWGEAASTPLLCTVDGYSFTVERDNWIAPGMAPLWGGGSGDEGPEMAACSVLDTLLERRRRPRDDE